MWFERSVLCVSEVWVGVCKEWLKAIIIISIIFASVPQKLLPVLFLMYRFTLESKVPGFLAPICCLPLVSVFDVACGWKNGMPVRVEIKRGKGDMVLASQGERQRMRRWEVRVAPRLPRRSGELSRSTCLITVCPPHPAWRNPSNPEEYTLATGHTYGPCKHICTSFCRLTNSEVSFIIPLPLIEITMQIPFINCDMDNFSQAPQGHHYIQSAWSRLQGVIRYSNGMLV